MFWLKNMKIEFKLCTINLSPVGKGLNTTVEDYRGLKAGLLYIE